LFQLFNHFGIEEAKIFIDLLMFDILELNMMKAVHSAVIGLTFLITMACSISGIYYPPTATAVSQQNSTSTATAQFIPSRTSTSMPSSTPDPTLTPTITATETPSPVPTRATPTPVVEYQDLSGFIGMTIPPLPEGMVQIFGEDLIDGEIYPDEVNYFIFDVLAGEKRMLWLGIDKTINNRFAGVIVTDIIILPDLEQEQEIIPFRCMRFGINRWGIIAIVESAEEWPTDQIIHAWIIQPETSTLKPITSEGVECYEYPFPRRPLKLFWFNN
jgi:hypothetical protein